MGKGFRRVSFIHREVVPFSEGPLSGGSIVTFFVGGSSLGGGLSLGLGQSTGGGGASLGQASLSLGSSLSQPSLGFSAVATSTVPATALPGPQSFNLQMPPLGKRKSNFNP